MQYGEFIAQNRSIQHDKSCPVIGSKGHGHKKNLSKLHKIRKIAFSKLHKIGISHILNCTKKRSTRGICPGCLTITVYGIGLRRFAQSCGWSSNG